MLLTGESNCYYATGFMGEGAALITRKGSWYFTDSRYTEAAEKAIGGAAVIGEISREKPFSALINDALAQTGAKNVGFEDESMTVAEHTAYTKKLSAALTPASALMTELRGSKDAEEIETDRRGRAGADFERDSPRHDGKGHCRPAQLPDGVRRSGKDLL